MSPQPTKREQVNKVIFNHKGQAITAQTILNETRKMTFHELGHHFYLLACEGRIRLVSRAGLKPKVYRVIA